MKTPAIFKQHTWLIETISKAQHISFSELSRLWQNTEMSGGSPLSRTTFNRYKDAILDMFGIIIECDRRQRGRWYIFNDHVLKQDTVQNWLFSTLSVRNLLGENTKLYDRIILERVPSADVHLRTLLKAMRDNHQVKMTYKRYGSNEPKTFVASPYCLKLFNRRWYALMNAQTSRTKEPHLLIFSLDRIGEVDIIPEKFSLPEDFNAEAFFEDCFGVVIGDGTEPVTIKLRAFGRERFSLMDLPIHYSQKLVDVQKDYSDFELCLRPTADFNAYLASKGQWVIVLSPQHLAEEIV